MRKVYTAQNGERRAVVHFSPAWNEYRVRLWIAGIADEAADYFTDDKEDACGTADELARDPVAVHRIANLIAEAEFDEYDLSAARLDSVFGSRG